MKNFLTILGFVFCLSVFTSCSVDDIEEYDTSVSQLKKADKSSVEVSSANASNEENPEESDCNPIIIDPLDVLNIIDPIKPPTKP